MTERGVFRLLARVGGLMLVALGLGDAVGSVFTALGLQSSRYYTALDRASAAATYLVVGLLMMFAAGVITRLFYGPDEGQPGT